MECAVAEFFLLRPSAGCCGGQCIRSQLDGVIGLCLPPFALIFKCLEKFSREKANVVLVCPVWPTQPWFPVLLELACDVPLLLKPTSTLLVSPLGIPHPLLAIWDPSGWPPGNYPEILPFARIFEGVGQHSLGQQPPGHSRSLRVGLGKLG